MRSGQAPLQERSQILNALHTLIQWECHPGSLVNDLPGAVVPQPHNRLACGSCCQNRLKAHPLVTFPLNLEVLRGCTAAAVEDIIHNIDIQPDPGEKFRVAIDSIGYAGGTVPSG